ncbi:MAG: hypothetical protein JRJ44_07975 [Deltaproteobacteria bacterium]|nr:hypothetical protein [Deltaproteobacteria bacterium]
MPFSLAQDIFNAQNYEDPAMRGRNSVAPLNKMGLCIAKNSAKAVKITPFGELLDLYKRIIELTAYAAHSEEWIEQIPKTITKWQKFILVRQ